jgi:Uma2 family endonuclease
MVAVQTTTDEMPGLAEFIADRHRRGLDTHDEWWEGVYRTVTGPSPEHGELLDALAELLGPLVRAAGLKSAAPVNIGVDKQDCRVPDRAIFEPDTPRTSPAFLAAALMVIEVLSPGERPKEKLGFYRDHGVTEYLEIDLKAGTVELGAWSGSRWEQVMNSEILPGLTVAGPVLVTEASSIDVCNYRP